MESLVGKANATGEDMRMKPKIVSEMCQIFDFGSIDCKRIENVCNGKSRPTWLEQPMMTDLQYLTQQGLTPI